jgi:ubiquinone/menaquinone biosynthesis C-methylase UbiE
MERDSSKSSGFFQSSAQWLALHHAAKLDQRKKFVSRLELRSGDRILEIGSGPGHFTELFANAIGPKGTIVAVDVDRALIELARGRRIANAEFIVGDFRDTKLIGRLKGQAFDVVVIFNCLGFDGEFLSVISKYGAIIPPEGRLLVKDSDMDHTYTNICDMKVYREVVLASKRRTDLPLDNFLGMKLFSSGHFDGAVIKSRYTWPYLFHSPFAEAQVQYVCQNMKIALENAKDSVSRTTASQFAEAFDDTRLRRAGSIDALFFLMHDFVIELGGSRA